MPFERSITFTIPGQASSPGVLVRAVESTGGQIVFTVDVQDSATSTADLRGLFFHMNEAKLGSAVVNLVGLVTDFQASTNRVVDLGNGANMQGVRSGPFDVGVEFGTQGIGSDDVTGPVTFTLSNAAGNLTLDDIANTGFGARLTSVGTPGSARNDSSRVEVVAPAAPDARNDSYTIFEDGQDGLGDPSTVTQGRVFQVLRNDTDADPGDAARFRITELSAPQHGTVQIVDGDDADSLAGDAILYTPNQNYAGTDSFQYVMTDDRGGFDFATVDVAVTAVADIPEVTVEVMRAVAGDPVNEVRLRITSAVTDRDGSESLALTFGGLPEGATLRGITNNTILNPGAETYVTLVLPTDRDIRFDLTTTATSTEASNGDTESTSRSTAIDLDVGSSTQNTTFRALNQNMWTSGSAFGVSDERFLGVDLSWNGPNDDNNLQLRTGFNSDFDFSGGAINAELPYNFTFNTIYNRTSDALQITPSAQLTGGSFQTLSPYASYVLDFLFQLSADFRATIDPPVIPEITLFDFGLDLDHTVNLIDFDTRTNPSVTIAPNGFIEITLRAPSINTSSGTSGGVISSSGQSANFLQLDVDMDQALYDLVLARLGVPNNPVSYSASVGFDFAGIAAGSAGFQADLVDVVLSAGMNFLQNFIMMPGGLADIAAVLTLEGGSQVNFSLLSPVVLTGVDALDVDNDGFEITAAFTPDARMQNRTSLGINLGYDVDFLKAQGSVQGSLAGVEVLNESINLGPLYEVGDSTQVASIPIYNNTFDLAFASNNVNFVIA